MKSKITSVGSILGYIYATFSGAGRGEWGQSNAPCLQAWYITVYINKSQRNIMY